MAKIHEISLWGDLDGETVADVIKMLQAFGPGAKFEMKYGVSPWAAAAGAPDRLLVIEPINETD